MKSLFGLGIATAALAAGTSEAAVTLVEPGHTLNQIVDSGVPLNPTQPALDTACAFGNAGNIESIGVDPATGTLYTQVSPGGFTSITSCVFSVSPVGVVTPVNLNTGFGINSRGTDLHFDPITGLLVTQDQNSVGPLGVERIATVNPVTGVTGTYSLVTPPVFSTGTFGMDFSAGVGGSDVPAGDIVFTGDVAANGIHSVTFGGLASTVHVAPPTPPLDQGGADDMVIQPDGDWVWVGDFNRPITAFSPMPPHPGAISLLDIQTMFSSAGLPFVFGSRATVCDTNGDLYVSYSGFPGGSGIFRVDETLTTATLVLNITGAEGLHDLTLGPSTSGVGNSVYFTVHDAGALTEEVWEVTVPECPVPAIEVPVDIKPQSCRNPLNVKSKGVLPVAILGTASFDVTQVDVATVQLEGVPPLRWEFEDVATPFVPFVGKQDAFDCTDEGADGFLDLALKFNKQAIIQALGPVNDGDVVVATLTGQLLDGTPIVGEDVVLILKKGTP
jgi:hypothetical protein